MSCSLFSSAEENSKNNETKHFYSGFRAFAAKPAFLDINCFNANVNNLFRASRK